MKIVRWFLMIAAALVAIVCVVLLLNFTAPNPTGRRYSSSSPATSDGPGAEAILATDLGQPINDISGVPGRCICNVQATPTSSNCTECIVNLPIEAKYRRPDFIGSGYIADSKNRQKYDRSQKEIAQLTDYANAAATLGYSFWVYIPLETTPNPIYVALARSTGGDVVHYFTGPNHRDPVDEGAIIGLAVSVIVLAGVLVVEVVFIRGREARPRGPSGPTGDLDAFTDRIREQAQQDIDRENAREDMD